MVSLLDMWDAPNTTTVTSHKQHQHLSKQRGSMLTWIVGSVLGFHRVHYPSRDTLLVYDVSHSLFREEARSMVKGQKGDTLKGHEVKIADSSECTYACRVLNVFIEICLMLLLLFLLFWGIASVRDRFLASLLFKIVASDVETVRMGSVQCSMLDLREDPVFVLGDAVYWATGQAGSELVASLNGPIAYIRGVVLLHIAPPALREALSKVDVNFKAQVKLLNVEINIISRQ